MWRPRTRTWGFCPLMQPTRAHQLFLMAAIALLPLQGAHAARAHAQACWQTDALGPLPSLARLLPHPPHLQALSALSWCSLPCHDDDDDEDAARVCDDGAAWSDGDDWWRGEMKRWKRMDDAGRSPRGLCHATRPGRVQTTAAASHFEVQARADAVIAPGERCALQPGLHVCRHCGIAQPRVLSGWRGGPGVRQNTGVLLPRTSSGARLQQPPRGPCPTLQWAATPVPCAPWAWHWRGARACKRAKPLPHLLRLCLRQHPASPLCLLAPMLVSSSVQTVINHSTHRNLVGTPHSLSESGVITCSQAACRQCWLTGRAHCTKVDSLI